MSSHQQTSTTSSAQRVLAVVLITALFFIWAFVTNLIDPLVKSMKVIYTLTDFQAQLNSFAFFIAYGVMSIPAAAYLARKGYSKSVILGLLGVVAGCLVAFSTTYSHSFTTVLIGLFIAASGITLLQVAANPLIASMGEKEGAHFRLNLSQAFNSLGAYCGMYFGAHYLLKGPLFEKNAEITEALKASSLTYVTNIYLVIAAILIAFIAVFFLLRRVVNDNSPKLPANPESPFSAMSSKWANLGALGIFLYVGAEVCVAAGLIFFLEQEQILNVSAQQAGYVAAFFMLFAMFGRFIGSALLKYVKATTMLALFAACASLLCAFVMFSFDIPSQNTTETFSLLGQATLPVAFGAIPAMAAILLGLFNSIMFPTIFTITLERSTAPASATSGLMCMAICGGAFMAILYGFTVDQLSQHFTVGARSLAFVVPLACYLYVLWFAWAARKAPTHEIQEDMASAH